MRQPDGSGQAGCRALRAVRRDAGRLAVYQFLSIFRTPLVTFITSQRLLNSAYCKVGKNAPSPGVVVTGQAEWNEQLPIDTLHPNPVLIVEGYAAAAQHHRPRLTAQGLQSA